MDHLGLWVLAVTGAILLAEVIAGRHRGIYSRSDWLVNAICMVGAAVVRPAGTAVVAMAIAYLFPGGQGALRDVPFVPALIGIVLIGEFVNYWVHRGSHQLKGSAWFDWFWRMHRTHHTARYVNVVLNFRISPFWILVGGLGWVFALAIYLGQPQAAGVGIAIFTFWGIFTHSDFRWDDAIRSHPVLGSAFRALEHVFVSPGIHHSHHGYGRDGGNFRNFGVFLSIYDWVFGTLHIPEGRPFRYGIPGATPHWADDAFSPLLVGSFLTKAAPETAAAPARAE